MKISTLLGFGLLFLSLNSFAQADKSKRPSPPAVAVDTLKTGTIITIDYSQPSLKGRSVGKEVATYGQVWRTGANEATTFHINKDVKIGGKRLPAGKYSLFTIPNEKEWIIIFNKTWNQWGTKYNAADDVLRITAKPVTTNDTVEKMTFNIEKDGEVELLWGNVEVDFKVK